MRGVRKFLATLVAIVAMLSAPGWSSAASACMYEGTMNVVAGAPMTTPHVSHHKHRAARPQKEAPPAPAPGPETPRLDCAACMAVLPDFPSVGSRELMPFMPTAQTFKPLSGIEPLLDPPPPRRVGK